MVMILKISAISDNHDDDYDDYDDDNDVGDNDIISGITNILSVTILSSREVPGLRLRY